MEKKENSEIFRQFLSANANEKLVISSHRKVDVDGLACAFALNQILPNSVIAVEDMDDAASALAQKSGIVTLVLRELDKKQYPGLVVVDTASYTLLEPARDWKILLVIDHHHPQGRDMLCDNFIIDEDSPSTAEIIAGLLGPVSEKVATALAAAIISDTARFKSGRAETFETLSRLMKISGASYHELLGLAEPELRPDVKMAILKAFQRVSFSFVGGYVIATSEVGSNESDAAQAISEAADVAFVASWKDREKETRISARARKNVTIPLNEVMKEVGVSLGGNGGGHPKAAGASVKVHTQEALRACVDEMMARLGQQSLGSS